MDTYQRYELPRERHAHRAEFTHRRELVQLRCYWTALVPELGQEARYMVATIDRELAEMSDHA